MANITLKNSLHLLQHYVQIFVLRLSLFLQVCSIHQAHFYQNYCLRTNMQYIKMFYLSFIYIFCSAQKKLFKSSYYQKQVLKKQIGPFYCNNS